MDDQQFGVWFQPQQETLLLSSVFRPALEPTQSPAQWVLGALSLGVKRQRHEGDHSPTSIAEVKNGKATPPLHLSFHDVVFH
jgi:hypothetical protein